MNEHAVVAFLDCGQGDSAVIVLPGGDSAIVVDCSSCSAVAAYLELHHVESVEWLYVSHTDADHMGGAADFAENFVHVAGISVNIDTPDVARGKRRLILRRLLELHHRHRLDFCYVFSGYSCKFSGVTMEALYPEHGDHAYEVVTGGCNDASCLLRATFEGAVVLFTGDLGARGWTRVLSRGIDVSADVMKYPHHGGWYDASQEEVSLSDVVTAVAPQLVVLSVGSTNKYRHPASETLQLLRSRPDIRIMCTEATPRCHPALATERRTLPCAGTVEVTVGSGILAVSPDAVTHSAVMGTLSEPQCLPGES